ncbi:MAG TPA: hypothetical protein VF062_09955 [Candidatus Limnocylindrales bacterium]
MPDFMSMRMSSPAVFNSSAGAALAAAAQALGEALKQYQKTADLSTAWKGSSSTSHTDRLAKLADAASRVIQAMAQANTITTTGGTQLQALKMQNDAIVGAALSGQFQVLPTGQVMPGPAHYAQASGPHGPALMKLFWTIAKLFSAQINGTVAASSMTDAQVAATLATVAVEFFADLLRDDSNGSSGAVTLPPWASDPSVLPPGATIGPDGTIQFPGLTGSNSPDELGSVGGTALAGAGTLGGGALGLGPAGLGSLGAAGVSGLGGVGGVGTMGGMGAGGVGALGAGGLLAGPGAAGAMGAGATGSGAAGSGAGGGAARAAGTTPAGMMPMGGTGAAASNQQRREAETWLREDGDPFDPGDAPESVIS